MRSGIPSDLRTWRKLPGLFLFYVPVLYIGIILAVAVHEIAGHGLAALALGGSFRGFAVYVDGMGWASIDVTGLSALGQAAMLSAGGASTAIAAVALIATGAAFREKPNTQAAFFVLGFVCLMDGVPYVFWDAVFLSGIGDFSMISKLYPSPFLRASVIGLCGFLMAVGIAVFNVLIWRLSLRMLGSGFLLRIKSRIALAVLLLAMQAAGWFSFDWNELVPGTGGLPAVLALILTLATLIALVYPRASALAAEKAAPPDDASMLGREISSEPVVQSQGDTISMKPTIFAWATAAVIALMTLLWTGKGVFF